MIELGNNIVLSGFKEIDKSSLIVVKKLVGNYARKINNLHGEFNKLTLNLKEVHVKEKSEKFEIKGRLEFTGEIFNAEAIDMNLFFVIDKVLNRLKLECEKKKK